MKNCDRKSSTKNAYISLKKENYKRPHHRHRHYVSRTPFVSRTPTPLISAIQRKSDEENDAKNDDVPVNGTINGTINDFEQIVLNLISENPGISAIQLVQKADKSLRTIKRALSVLIDSNLIERRGAKKTGGYWTKL